jgi:nucleoside phosphorylase
MLDKAYEYYNGYNIDKKYNKSPCTLKIDDAGKFAREYNNIILVLTVNDVESDVFLRYMSDRYKVKNVKRYIMGELTFAIICIGNYTIIHSKLHDKGDEQTRRAVNAFGKIFDLYYVVLLGVCYGVDCKMELATVVVADHVIGYRVDFRDDNDDLSFDIYEEFDEKPQSKLISRIQGYYNFCQINNLLCTDIEDNYSISIKTGKILSANSLISSKRVKDAIVDSFGNAKPHPLGGEMEACGIFKSNFYEVKKNWFMIKSFCDWGERKNSFGNSEMEIERNKDSIQALAMVNSCTVFTNIIENNLLEG